MFQHSLKGLKRSHEVGPGASYHPRGGCHGGEGSGLWVGVDSVGLLEVLVVACE